MTGLFLVYSAFGTPGGILLLQYGWFKPYESRFHHNFLLLDNKK